MDSLDYWRLADALSVFQAAVLIAGGDPTSVQAEIDQRGSSAATYPDGFPAAMAALQHAILGRRLPATVRARAGELGAVRFEFIEQAGWKAIDATTSDGSDAVKETVFFEPRTDWHATTVFVEDLRTWLRSRGLTTGFFFPQAAEAPEIPGYLDPNHPRYPRKLAAAVSAWLAVEKLPPGRNAKQALAKWLRENAARFELTDDDGVPVKGAVEECSAVANWQPGGGAPATPERNLPKV